jgi:hypothetical protein
MVRELSDLRLGINDPWTVVQPRISLYGTYVSREEAIGDLKTIKKIPHDPFITFQSSFDSAIFHQ